MHPRFTTSCILMSAAVLALPSCRIINGKPDFHWIGDQFTPAVDDSVFVDRGVGALDIPASEVVEPTQATAAAPMPIPQPTVSQEQSAGIVSQRQPEPKHSPAPEATVPTHPIVYNVVAGDTLSGIAARHNTKTKTLIEFNKLDINKPLQLNQKLLIPVPGATLPAPTAAPRPQEQPGTNDKPGFFARIFGQTGQSVKQEYHHKTYSVVAGDTLSAIARRHGTTTRALIELNKLDINKPLQINQQLQIPVPGAAPKPAAPRRAPAPEKQEGESTNTSNTETVSVILPPQQTEQQQPQQAEQPQPVQQPQQAEPAQPQPQPQTKPAAAASSVYTIQPGDTLYGIARKLQLSPEFLMNANGLTPETADKLQAGATLNLPTPKQP